MNNFRKKNKQKSTTKWLILAATAVILIVSVILGYNYWRDEQTKTQAHETAMTFIEALEERDYQRLAEMFSSASLEKINYTKEEAQERYETIFNGIGVTDIQAENVSVQENEETNQFELSYNLHMTTSLGELEPQAYQTTLEQTDAGFDVNWNTHLLFPEMEPEDTVRISLNSGKRGNILDRNGELLAGERPAWQAGLYPAALGEGQERENTLQTIAETFETTTDHLESLLSAGWVTDESFVPFKIVNEGETPEVPGVLYQQTTARSYPLGEAGAHLIGYTGEVSAEDIEKDPTLQPGDIIGKSGLEATYDSRLRGKKGGKIALLDGEGVEKRILQEASVENGEDITLTINASLQKDYYDRLSDQSGAAVVTEPSSGELLVLTSSPSYDPTLMSRGISHEDYQAYAENEESPFLPRYTARYAPGSTFKVITAAIGLDTGITSPEKSHTISGLEWQKDESWGNFEVTRVSSQPTEVRLEDALVYSDNIYFAREAIEMGEETYLEGLMKFPFDEDFDLPISMQPAQITNSGHFDSEMLLADTSFGQGQLLMSPLHQAIFYSPFANEGKLVFPKLEMDIEAKGAIQPVSKEAAEIVKSALVQVVENPSGTARVLSNGSGSLAAKTGTTEVQGDAVEDGNDTNGFLLAFDAEDRSFLSVILIEDDSGSNVAEKFASLLTQ